MSHIKIIDHRGAWCNDFEYFTDIILQNSIESFFRSFQRGHGVEFDVRDYKGTLVISHDIPTGKELTLNEFFKLYIQYYDKAGTLAINIKADELQNKIKKLIEIYNIENYFLFDMSIPDTIKYLRQNLKFFIRHSEYEINPKKFSPYLYQECNGVWVDQFFLCSKYETWITPNILKEHLDCLKKIVIVSPELHPWGRSKKTKLYKKIWTHYKNTFNILINNNYTLDNIALCTDLPNEAAEFFISHKVYLLFLR